MLEQTRDTYEQIATLYIPNWRNTNKNELVRQAVANRETPSFDGYISAVMLKYWRSMMGYYHKNKLYITPEDAHAWLANAVMYAVDHHPWDSQDSSIYQDNNGPDKVINRVLASRRATFYQQLNRYNRKLNAGTVSLDALRSSCYPGHEIRYEDESTCEFDELIQSYFKVKDYFMAFFIDSILYEKYTVTTRSRPLVSHLKHLDESYCSGFAYRHGLDKNRVKRASTYIKRMDRQVIEEHISDACQELKKFLLD